MSNQIVPPATRLAAKRGFVRTASQTLAGAIPINGVTGAVLSGGDVRVICFAVAAAGISAVAAGAASYFQIIGSGIPDEYVAAGHPSTDPELGI